MIIIKSVVDYKNEFGRGRRLESALHEEDKAICLCIGYIADGELIATDEVIDSEEYETLKAQIELYNSEIAQEESPLTRLAILRTKLESQDIEYVVLLELLKLERR